MLVLLEMTNCAQNRFHETLDRTKLTTYETMVVNHCLAASRDRVSG